MSRDRTARDKLRRWRADPVAFVREELDAEPDDWQATALRVAAVHPRLAMSACKGPGKSCVLAWIILWFIAVHVNAQVMVVSITAANLKDNLWKELAMWKGKSELLRRAFNLTAERITSTEPGYEKTWWVSARAFSQNADATAQSNTLAGFHAEHCMIVLDEVGGYPNGVVVAAEAIFANEGNKHIIAAGNPEDVQGPLYAMTVDKRYHVIKITGDPDDPNRSPRISMEWAKAEIAKWGRENPWVMVNILGEFPPAGSKQLISINDVLAGMERDAPYLHYRSESRVWGLDPSRFGDDEASLARRQGILVRPFKIWRNLDGTELGDEVASLLLEAQLAGEKDPRGHEQLPDALFVDVGGVGASAFDRLKVLGWEDILIPVDFAGAPRDARFLNKRAEMWWDMAIWIKTFPVMLPKDAVLRAELPAPNYDYKVVGKRTVFVIEKKEDMKKRGVNSPNRADSLCITHAAPVIPKSRTAREEAAVSARTTKCRTDYNPLERMMP